MEELKESKVSAEKELSLWQVIAPVKRQIYVGMAFSVISGIAWVVAIVLLRPIVRELFKAEPDVSTLWRLGGFILLSIVIAIVLRIYSFTWSHLGAFELEEILRTRLTTHLAKVPLGYVVSTGSGTLKKILMDDVRSLHAFVADSTPLMARSYSIPIITLVVMFIVDWRMALISLIVFPVGIIATQFAFREYAEGRAAVDLANEKMNNTIIEYVQGMQVVRTFDDGSSSFRRYREALTEASATMRKWSDKSKHAAYIAGTLFAALPTLAVVVIAGGYFVANGTLDLPTLLLFVFIAPTLPDAILPVIWLSMLINMARAGAKRIGQLLAVPILPEADSPISPTSASVRFENVTFTYANRSTPALDDVSIEMPVGTVTALVGPSGAGKSTVARLIPRFWDVDAGAVYVGDVDVRQITNDDLMQQVSFVFQNPFLLHDTIRENIRLGKPNASDADVEAAAKAAQAHDFIVNELPGGYETKAGDRGTRLSGGQRQRITIARAILQDSPIIVLDEATAFADPENEAKIHAALANLTVGKTLIVVAHRLSTIQDADQIVVLDKGKVAERGIHADLVAADGIYANLWDKFNQAQGWGLRRSADKSLDNKPSQALEAGD
ncbi:MAG: ABC transporter ATP-binding protein [Chloroflexota bacterium]